MAKEPAPSKRVVKVDAKKSAKKAEENAAARLQSMRDNPRSTKGDFKFTYNSKNPDHRQLLDHLTNNGLEGDIMIHPDGQASFPRRTFIKDAQGKETLQPIIQRIVADKVSKSVAASKLAPRRSENTAGPSVRPAPLPPRGTSKPKPEKNSLIEDRSEVMRNLFGK